MCFVQLLQERIDIGRESGEAGCLLDGFPRTLLQAEALPSFTNVQLAVNLSLREEVSMFGCLVDHKVAALRLAGNWQLLRLGCSKSYDELLFVCP